MLGAPASRSAPGAAMALVGPKAEGVAHEPGCFGASGCPGADAVCFEAEGAVSAVDWRYVGEGRGGYSKVQSYNFVGQGRGSWNQEEVVTTYGWKLRPFCFGILVAMIVVMAAYVVVTTGDLTATTSVAKAELFDCSSSAAMSVVKREFCCRWHHTYCDNPTGRKSATPSAHRRYDCAGDLADWRIKWPLKKQAWCCQHAGQGCVQTASPPRAFPSLPVIASTSAPPEAFMVQQPSPLRPEGPGQLFDCDADLDNYAHAWSPTKQDFCCKRQNKGCHAD
mmetsp:Transcript_11873/g.33839  ORF Transcript_11873/g.33839 Transcript_11873/m.33839 type:complete len:279 (+) Transcript_11873:23-859(+)|eukprot:CAMPEP_0170269406 /NCGR_PEP_ID=MMETSP0116_2-20130129/34639_1 /TAXON_ID=400756 /ORGANISM="Durinskia baltica, Strain CSIRO CS-38" /LENGTH=278 /DNA_ID=CAMNT_0010520581 /DNA_START=23 /DNA_END=859 /DNA_ORIENTATION=-